MWWAMRQKANRCGAAYRRSLPSPCGGCERFVRVNDGGSEPIRNRESHVFSHVFSCGCHQRVESVSSLGNWNVMRERRSLARESRWEVTDDGIAIAGDAWMLSKGSWFIQF